MQSIIIVEDQRSFFTFMFALYMQHKMIPQILTLFFHSSQPLYLLLIILNTILLGMRCIRESSQAFCIMLFRVFDLFLCIVQRLERTKLAFTDIYLGKISREHAWGLYWGGFVQYIIFLVLIVAAFTEPRLLRLKTIVYPSNFWI